MGDRGSSGGQEGNRERGPGEEASRGDAAGLSGAPPEGAGGRGLVSAAVPEGPEGPLGARVAGPPAPPAPVARGPPGDRTFSGRRQVSLLPLPPPPPPPPGAGFFRAGLCALPRLARPLVPSARPRPLRPPVYVRRGSPVTCFTEGAGREVSVPAAGKAKFIRSARPSGPFGRRKR